MVLDGFFSAIAITNFRDQFKEFLKKKPENGTKIKFSYPFYYKKSEKKVVGWIKERRKMKIREKNAKYAQIALFDKH